MTVKLSGNISSTGTIVPKTTEFLAITSVYLNIIERFQTTVYQWTSTGFGQKYSGPAVAFGTGAQSPAFSPDGKVLAVGERVFEWSRDGFGEEYSLSDYSFRPNYVTFNPSGDVIAFAGTSGTVANRLAAFPWSNISGQGTKYSPPSSPPDANGPLVFSPDGSVIAVPQYGTPFVSAYPWSNQGGFGTKYSNPAGFPQYATQAYNVSFSPSNSAVALGIDETPWVIAFPWSSISGFGTKYSDPSVLSPFNTTAVQFSPDRHALLVGTDTSPYLTAYNWSSSGFGTKYSAPSTIPTGRINDIQFNKNGNVVAVAHQTSPYVSVYPWSPSTGFGTKFSNPVAFPTAVRGHQLSFGLIT